MMRHLMCAIYLLIAISSVRSASYHSRFGREVVVPAVDEVKEVISELKKDEPVIVDESIVAAASVVPNVEQTVAVKSVPESVVPIGETIQQSVDSNVVADNVVVPPVVPVGDVARAKPNPSIRLDTLEVISPGGKSDKVQTVADTVKIAAVQAIEKQNEEIEKSKPIVADEAAAVAPVVKTVVEEKEPVVESVSVVKTPEPVVPIVKDDSVKSDVAAAVVEPAVVAEKVVETVRSAEPEPTKPEPVKPDSAKPDPFNDEQKEEKIEKAEPQVEKTEYPVRQDSSQTAGPLNQIQTALNQITSNIQTAFNGIIANTPFANRPQSDGGQSGGLNTNEVATNAVSPTQAAPAPTTAAPNLLANVQSAINNLATSIFPRPTTAPAAAIDATSAVQTPAQTGTRVDQTAQEVTQASPAATPPANIISNLAVNVQNALNNIATNIFQRTTVAPTPSSSAAPPTGVKGSKPDDEIVEVVHNIDIVNDKVDLVKKDQ